VHCPGEDLVEFHLHLDADRDGKVDADRTGLDKWHWGAGKKGAIILCNNDDDEGASASDNHDAKINKGNDRDEIAPLVIRRVGSCDPPATWEGFLEVATADKDRIRIFESRSTGAKEIIGPAKGNSFKLPDLKFTEKEFGMEATQYADGTWDGEVTITLRITKGAAGTAQEKGVVRVAPWIMPNHLDKAEKVFVVDAGTDFPPGVGGTDNSRFRSDLSTRVSSAGCSLQTHKSDDRWMQDCMEFGFANLPLTGFRVVVPSPQDVTVRPLHPFPKTLRKADLGFQDEGDSSTSTTFDSTGNLETSPPATSKAGKKYPFGRIYFGPGRPGEELDADKKAFLNKQVVQRPIEIDTNWLTVGHVDEIISFVPASGGKGFKLLLASPKLAYKILTDNNVKNGTAKLLTGRKFPELVADPVTGAITGIIWHNGETTIKDFLSKGMPSLAFSAGAAHLYTASNIKAFNDSASARIDGTRTKFKNELGLDEADIIDVPILYAPNDQSPAFADALTAGMVNMLVINKNCIVPDPFGPIVGGKDVFKEDLRGKLKALGLTVNFLDDWYEYHVLQGEVHCGTNTLRIPTSAKWWEFEP
jgi:protein-arginine deiminase